MIAFPQQTPRPFTRAGIEALAPNQMGCYGIYRQGQCVYVGRGDIRTRLLASADDAVWLHAGNATSPPDLAAGLRR